MCMKNVGILGGSFNPVHLEHVEIAKHAIKELSLDKLYIVPSFISPHKKNMPPVSGEHRLNMLNIAFSGQEKVEISSFEIDNGGTSYTYITAEHFKSIHSQDNLYFICGGDMLADFKNWKNPQRILNACTLCVFDRSGFSVDYQREQEYFTKTFDRRFIKLNYVGRQNSSTKIRTYLSLKLNDEDMIDKSVFEYIIENGLYVGDEKCEFIINNLTEKRRVHTAEVVITALSKYKELGLIEEKVRTSALLHDCAKYLDYKEYKDFVLEEDVPPPVVHAFLGAHIAKTVLGVQDEEIIDAIKYHTSGKANMSLLGKLIFVADMVEKNRNYQGVELLRALYETDFERCFVECVKEEMLHLINKKGAIYIETLNAYEYYVKKEGR